MQTMSGVIVSVMHEDPVVDAGLRALLREQPGIELLPSATVSGADVVVADYRGALAMHALAQMDAHASRHPCVRTPPRFMIVTVESREWEVRCALSAGIHGYVLQGCPTEEIIAGVRALGRSARYLCQAATRCIVDSLVHDALTSRELDVLRLLAHGLCNKAIARDLGIAIGTVKAHVKAILVKLGASSRTHAVVLGSQRGLVGIDEAQGSLPTGKPGPSRRTMAAGAMVVPVAAWPG